jgi:predicted RNase H-like HicB family nuclease
MKELQITIEQSAEGDWWVSCDEITGFYACGDTRKEALENAKEAVSMFLGLEPASFKFKIVVSHVADDGSG